LTKHGKKNTDIKAKTTDTWKQIYWRERKNAITLNHIGCSKKELKLLCCHSQLSKSTESLSGNKWHFLDSLVNLMLSFPLRFVRTPNLVRQGVHVKGTE
jgi:hypothetical protein